MTVVRLLNTRPQIQLAPLGPVVLAIIVARLKQMARVETDLPHVLAHRVTPNPTPRPKADVVVDFAVENQSACVVVVLVLRSFEPSCFFDLRFLRDEMIGLHATHHLRTEVNYLTLPGIAAFRFDRAT